MSGGLSGCLRGCLAGVGAAVAVGSVAFGSAVTFGVDVGEAGGVAGGVVLLGVAGRKLGTVGGEFGGVAVGSGSSEARVTDDLRGVKHGVVGGLCCGVSFLGVAGSELGVGGGELGGVAAVLRGAKSCCGWFAGGVIIHGVKALGASCSLLPSPPTPSTSPTREVPRSPTRASFSTSECLKDQRTADRRARCLLLPDRVVLVLQVE